MLLSAEPILQLAWSSTNYPQSQLFLPMNAKLQGLTMGWCLMCLLCSYRFVYLELCESWVVSVHRVYVPNFFHFWLLWVHTHWVSGLSKNWKQNSAKTTTELFMVITWSHKSTQVRWKVSKPALNVEIQASPSPEKKIRLCLVFMMKGLHSSS